MTLIPLQGHTSFESAYIQGDYPYGRQLRCKRAVWLETAEKGAKKGQMRFVYRTTDPKAKGDKEVWNKPSPGGYSDFLLLVYNDENGYVEHIGMDAHRVEKDSFNAFHAKYYSLLDQENRSKVDFIGILAATNKEVDKHRWVANEECNPVMPENCIIADDAWLYRPETGIHQFVLARVQGAGDADSLPVVSAIEYNASSGKTYNALNQRRLKEVEAQARLVAAMPDHQMGLEHFTQSVLHRFRTFDWTEQDGRSLPMLLDEMQSADKEAHKAIRQQIKDICSAYHAELISKGGEIPQIRESVKPVEPKTIETMQWLALAFESAPHCPRLFNPIDIVDQDHGLEHRFVNPVPNVFGSDTEEVYRLLAEDGDRLIVNTSRPIPGEYCFESDFRHGIFYAVGTLRSYGDEWESLDAWDIFFVDNRAILRYIDKAVQKYGYASLPEYVADKFSGDSVRTLNLIKDIAESKGLPWASRPEPEILLVRDAVNSGINTIAALVDRFYGDEQYDYTEYEVTAAERMQRVVDGYLLDSFMGYEMQGDIIVPIPDSPPEETPMTDVQEAQAVEPDELEATGDEFGDGDFAIDHNQESAWSAETDDGAIDEPEEEQEDTDALYRSILLLSADNSEALQFPHVDRVMQEACDRGLLSEFRNWLLDQPMEIKARRAVMQWQPEEQDDEPVSVAIAPPAARFNKREDDARLARIRASSSTDAPTQSTDEHVRDEILLILQGLSHIPAEGRNECIMAMHRNGIVGCFEKHGFVPKKQREAIANAILAAENPDVLAIVSQHLNPPAPAPEPDVYVLKKAISEENADLILFMLQEHGLSGIVAEMFEVKSAKKAVSGQVIAKKSPHRDSVKVQKGNPAVQAQKNAEDFEEYMEIYNLALQVGPSEAARRFTAGGRKMGNTTVSQIKIAIGKYLANQQIRAWFDQGLITWSHVYAGRGDVGAVVEKLRAIAEKNQGA